MPDEDFTEDEAELDDDLDEDLDDEDLDDEDDAEDLDLVLDDDLPADGEDLVEGGDALTEEEVVEPVANVATAAEPRAEDEEDEDGLDLDEELHPDDVEAPLDALLKERTATAKLEDEEEEVEEEEVELDDRSGEGPTKIMPRRPGEFLCSSCFLVLPRNQLVDEERMLCRDCA
jgi:hypothetical protein